MEYGYCRQSAIDQKSLEWQKELLVGEGVLEANIFCEKESAADMINRPVFKHLLNILRPGDKIVLYSLDRAFRNLADLVITIESFKKEQKNIKILDFGNRTIDTSSATDVFFMQVMGAVSEFFRSSQKEKQKHGIAKAKAEGKYKGRQATIDVGKIKDLKNRNFKPEEIAKVVGCSRASVYRLLKER